MAHATDAFVALRLRHELPVIRADDRSVEAAFELLRVLLLGELAPGEVELGLRDEPGLARLEHQREPVRRIGLRAHPGLIELVAPARRADEHRPAGAIGEHGPDHLRPQPRVHVRVFVEHDAVEIDAVQRVRVVGAVEPHLPAVVVIDAQLAVVDRSLFLSDRIAQVIPCDGLRLLEKGRHVGKARPDILGGHGAIPQLVNAGDRLARAPMRDDAGEALRAVVERHELRARNITVLALDPQGRAEGRAVDPIISFSYGARPLCQTTLLNPCATNPAPASTALARIVRSLPIARHA